MSDTEHYIFHRGNKPLLITMPHTGTVVPEHIAERLTHDARSVPDTDWHIEKLYAFAREAGASILQAKWSRYVVDLNRPLMIFPCTPDRQQPDYVQSGGLMAGPFILRVTTPMPVKLLQDESSIGNPGIINCSRHSLKCVKSSLQL